MAALAPVWTRDPRDLGERQHKPAAAWESESVFGSSPPAGLMWTEQLSSHLQRNKQLRDTLLQREEELARLQDENNKLRDFLSSSFVRNLEEKAKKLTAAGRKKLKRNLMCVDDERFQDCGHQLVTPQQVSKRVCRNLTAEFCSESIETSAHSEPNLDLWVLRTLGLKDRDTIDTSSESPSSSGYSLRSFVYDTVDAPSTGHSLNASFSPSAATSAPSSVHSYYQSPTCQTEYRYHAAECQEVNSPQNCTTSPGPQSDFTPTGLAGQYEAPDLMISSCNTLTAFESPPVTEALIFTQSPNKVEVCSTTASSQAATPQEKPVDHLAYWSASQDTMQVSPPGERVPFSPVLSSSPVPNHAWTPIRSCSLTSPSAGSQPPATPQMPSSRTDLAFSMSLSPSSSVKTHSFPQGQAFVRKDNEGRWNFTWVPRQGP